MQNAELLSPFFILHFREYLLSQGRHAAIDASQRDDYVTKPFSIEELLARAQAFLRRGRAKKTKEFRVGDFQFDADSHRLLRAGAEISLTPKEFDLLRLFLSRPGRALTRDAIVRSVWGINVFVTLRSVDRCVTTLRKKIEPDLSRPTYIQTILDVGYRFEASD